MLARVYTYNKMNLSQNQAPQKFAYTHAYIHTYMHAYMHTNLSQNQAPEKLAADAAAFAKRRPLGCGGIIQPHIHTYMHAYIQDQAPEKFAADAAAFTKRRPLGCRSIVQLSTIDIGDMWFEVISQYDTIAEVLVVLSILR